MSEHKGIAGSFIMGEANLNHYASDVPWSEPALTPEQVTVWPFTSEADLREFVRKEVHQTLDELANELRKSKAFQPVATINSHEHRRIDMNEESGKRWRGVLYRVDEEKAARVPESGVCWACGEHGDCMMWYERDGRSHLIHCAVECIKAAEIKPETREHRG